MYLKYLLINSLNVLKNKGIVPLAKETIIYIKKIFLIPIFLYKSRKYQFNDNLNSLSDFVLKGCGELIKPIQVRSEIIDLLQIIKQRKPKHILEIGTASGGTLYLFTRVVTDDAHILSIDLPGGYFGGGYPGWKTFLYKSFAQKNQKIILLRKNSHSDETLQSVKNLLDGKKIDFLFIDGDHTYEGVKKDFEMYFPLVSENGLIAFHDIVTHREGSGREVSKFWNEIKSNYCYKEIVENWNQKWAGIGLLEKKTK